MRRRVFFVLALALLLACNMPGGGTPAPEEIVAPTETPVTVEIFTPAPEVPEVPTEVFVVPVEHVMQPYDSPPVANRIYDVESMNTAPQKRAPYGDSYKINRLERPFLKDMTYVPDLDISNFSVSGDGTWYYVSIDLIGSDPNNAAGIHYGVELDANRDGFGDHIVWASPPYTDAWDTLNVKIYSDKNRDSAGLSPERADAPVVTDGYESLTFDGGAYNNADSDLAWARINAGERATVQFAFKSAWSGSVFMLGVIADAGLKDPTKLDYVDRFTEEQAGSPMHEKKSYPLGELFAVDNTCQEAFGFKPSGYEPKLCPREPASKTPLACGVYASQLSCENAGCHWLYSNTVPVYGYCAP